MRVIAGKLRGRPLDAPKGNTTRPMTDRVKESIFNMLGHRFETPGALPAVDVLDLFAGSGALGIEALSRGARSCTFVERDRRSIATLRSNLNRLQLGAVARVVAENAWTLRYPLDGAEFSLILVDPPYVQAREPLRLADLLERIGAALAHSGLLVIRQERSAPPFTEHLVTLAELARREFGRMRVQILVRRDSTLPAPGVADGNDQP